MKYIIISLLSIFTLYSCNTKNAEANNKDDVEINENAIKLTTAQMQNAGIVEGQLEDKILSSTLKLYGKIDVPPQNMVSISLPLGGYLKSTKLLEGMHVNKGETIATVEDPQYIQLQQDYLTTQSKINYVQLEYKRQKDLNESKASSDKMVQQTYAELQALQITSKGLAEKLQLIGINPSTISTRSFKRSISVHAPINGYVTKVNVNIGKYVSPTDILFELVNPDDIHLALKVFEKDLLKLFIGQKLFAYTNNAVDRKYECEIILVGKELNAESNTEVHCHFEQYDKSLIPGTYMNAEVEIKSEKSVVLPEEAIVHFENKNYAFIKKATQEYEMIEMLSGNKENGYVQLVEPDSLLNKTFVIKGAYSLLMALKNKEE